MYTGEKMTDPDLFKDAFPKTKDPNIIKDIKFSLTNSLQKQSSFFQGVVIKYVVRYLMKDKEKDLDKIIHYCQLEKKRLKDGD